MDVSVGLVGTVNGDACERGRASEYVVTGSDCGFTGYMPSYVYRRSVFVLSCGLKSEVEALSVFREQDVAV